MVYRQRLCGIPRRVDNDKELCELIMNLKGVEGMQNRGRTARGTRKKKKGEIEHWLVEKALGLYRRRVRKKKWSCVGY